MSSVCFSCHFNVLFPKSPQIRSGSVRCGYFLDLEKDDRSYEYADHVHDGQTATNNTYNYRINITRDFIQASCFPFNQ